MRVITILTVFLVSTATVMGQRIVYPGQNQLYRFLEDPSYVANDGFSNMTGILQASDSDVAQTSQYIAAQLSFFDNFAFGLEYSRHSFDYYRYSQLLISGRLNIELGSEYHFFSLGFAAGPDQSSQSPAVVENEVGTIYRLGGHYTNYNFTVGGFLNSYPVQDMLNNMPIVGNVDGYSIYTSYQISLSNSLRFTPLVRYNSYSDSDLDYFEGVAMFNYKGKSEIAFSYKNDYSLNAALNAKIFKKVRLGYSYEKAMGIQNFNAVHSLSLSVDLIPKSAEIPEWLANVKRKNAKPKKSLPKKEIVIEEERVDEVVIDNDSIIAESIEDVTIVGPPPMKENDPEDTTVNGYLKPGYYIILGSFVEIENAEKEVDRLRREGSYARFGRKNAEDKFNYIYVDRYTDREIAIERTIEKQKEKGFEKVWLLRIR